MTSALEAREAHTHGELLRFACDTIEAELWHLPRNQRRAKAVTAARMVFVDAEMHIAREAGEDWPAFARRLSALGDALAGLSRHDIDLTGLGVQRDYVTDKQRTRAKPTGRATAHKRKPARKRKAGAQHERRPRSRVALRVHD